MSCWWQDIRFGARLLAKDPWITAVIVLGIMAPAFLPARRVSRMDPIRALRYE